LTAVSHISLGCSEAKPQDHQSEQFAEPAKRPIAIRLQNLNPDGSTVDRFAGLDFFNGRFLGFGCALPRAGSPAEHLGWGARLYAIGRSADSGIRDSSCGYLRYSTGWSICCIREYVPGVPLQKLTPE
jgi:hypothetical protein